MTRPVWDERRIHLTLNASPVSARRAREATDAALPPDVPSRERNEILIMVSELVSNAVLHGAEPLAFDATVEHQCIRVAMHDCSATLPRLREPGTSGGYGLRLVDSISDEWGCTRSDSGKQVWAVKSWE